jgi:hypothetical protein
MVVRVKPGGFASFNAITQTSFAQTLGRSCADRGREITNTGVGRIGLLRRGQAYIGKAWLNLHNDAALCVIDKATERMKWVAELRYYSIAWCGGRYSWAQDSTVLRPSDHERVDTVR